MSDDGPDDGPHDGPDDASAASASPADADGRHRRRGRNRDAVVDAMLSLFRDGMLQPSAAEIAARAGLSQRSLFRYFADLDALARLTISRQLQDLVALIPIDTTPDAPRSERVRALASQRVRLYGEAEPVARVSRLRAPFHQVVAEQLDRGRRFLRRQVEELFAAELGSAPHDVAARTIAAIDVMTSFESYQLFRHDQGLTPDETVGTLVAAISALLDAATV